MHRRSSVAILLGLVIVQMTFCGALASPNNSNLQSSEEPPSWPEGSTAYDHMVQMADFGYRQIDTQANFAARDWIAGELENMGYEVERQQFTTQECDNCENLVVTINGTLEDDWIVVGAHHDAICYSPPPGPVGIVYPTCTSDGAYDDGTGSGSLLELARTFSEWNQTPLHTWKLGWWDYEEWQGSSSSESGGQGSLHFVTEQIPDDVNVTYVNLDMFGLNWPVPTPLASQLSGCDEDYWTLYMFTSPVSDWSYYEDRGLEVTDEMRSEAEWFQNHLKEINTNLTHPEEWVSVIDDTKGNSDHYNFIMHNHTATWIRGQHQYIMEEGDTCEQTPKHSQSDSVAVINTMAGGRANLESGLQTGLDIVATLAWWDWTNNHSNLSSDDDTTTMSMGSGRISILIFTPWFLAIFVLVGFISIRRDEFQLGFIIEDEKDTPVEILSESHSNGKSLIDNYTSRVITLCVLYVAQGMPSGFITVTLVTYLVTIGVGVGDVAYILTLGTLPWTFKFLWGPVIDRYQYPSMGRRRPWILIAQSGMIIVLSSMLLIPDMATDVKLIGIMFLVYNIFTALQDVSTDALAVDVLKPHEYEKVNSYMFTSKAIGAIIGGAGLGTVIGFIGIKGAIAVQIPILVLIMLVPLFMTERPGEKMFPWSKGSEINFDDEIEEKKSFKEILLKIKTAFSIRSAKIGIVFSMTGALASMLIPILPLLFLWELGWGPEEFNAAKGGIIMVMHILGYVVGGQLGKRYGGKLVIVYSTVCVIICLVFWGIATPLWSNWYYMLSIWSLYVLLAGVVAINAYSLLMRITWGEVGGTQFTGYMAMFNLSAVIGYQISEPLTSRFDFTTIFLIAAFLESILILGVIFIDPDETRRILGDESTTLQAELVVGNIMGED